MRVENLQNHKVNQMNSYLFDTNVWLYIYGPMAGSAAKKQRQYANLLREIVDRNAGLFITSMVLSEYINRVLRIEFEQWKKQTGNTNANYKKDFRPTAEFDEALKDVKAQVKDILSNCPLKRPDDFNSIDVEDVIKTMSKTSDFNDVYLVRCCEKGDLCFVSDDRDIQTIGSSIRLLQAW